MACEPAARSRASAIGSSPLVMTPPASRRQPCAARRLRRTHESAQRQAEAATSARPQPDRPGQEAARRARPSCGGRPAEHAGVAAATDRRGRGPARTGRRTSGAGPSGSGRRATGSGGGSARGAPASSDSGSTYASVTRSRAPRCTCGCGLARPTVPTRAPGTTTCPRRTAAAARCWYVATSRPQRTLTVSPPRGTRPAKLTRPPQAARTRVPGGAARSTPRCWPAAKRSPPTANARSTGPSTGRSHPRALARAGSTSTSRR